MSFGVEATRWPPCPALTGSEVVKSLEWYLASIEFVSAEHLQRWVLVCFSWYLRIVSLRVLVHFNPFQNCF